MEHVVSMTRYARQIVLPEIGPEGQKKLKAASVLCIGAGGLGAPALLYLAAAGIGRIGIVDDDTVDITNLQRQVLFTEADQGKFKAEAAKTALSALNQECHIEAYPERFCHTNAARLLAAYDVIIDGTDNFTSKFLINDACVKYGKPLVYGSILGFEAQASVFWSGHGPCYRCLYPKPPSGHIPNCAEAGVVGAMAGITGAVQALEAIKMALGTAWCQQHSLKPLLGTLWMLDARTMQTKSLKLPIRHACPTCSIDPATIVIEDVQEVGCATQDKVKTVSAETAITLLHSAVFIDVREAHELTAGIIPGSRHIPLGSLLKDGNTLSGLPSHTPIIVYCQHGVRSLSGANHLRTLGFTDVAHLEGGIACWTGEMA